VKNWRMHPEPGSKWYLKGPHWRVCNDQHCALEHVEYEPFQPIHSTITDPNG
jgi:hypothetical protein